MPTIRGSHRIVWDLRCEGAERLKAGGPRPCRPPAMPGVYSITLETEGVRQSQTLQVALDPRSESSAEETVDQNEFLCTVRDQVSKIHRAVTGIHRLYDDIHYWSVRAPAGNGDLRTTFTELRARLEQIEGELVQPKMPTHQAMGALPRLADQLIYLFDVAASADRRPTAQTRAAYEETTHRTDEVLAELEELVSGLDTYNEMIAASIQTPLHWTEVAPRECAQDNERGRQ